MPKISLIPKEEENHRLAYTMVVVAFGMSLLWWLAWILGTAMGFEVPEWSAAECTIFLTPVLGLHFGEKWQAGKNKQTAIDNFEKNKASVLLAKNEQENISNKNSEM